MIAHLNGKEICTIPKGLNSIGHTDVLKSRKEKFKEQGNRSRKGDKRFEWSRMKCSVMERTRKRRIQLFT